MTAAISTASIPCLSTPCRKMPTTRRPSCSAHRAIWAPSDNWKITPSYYYQDRYANDVQNYWPLYSNPGSERYVDANPTQRTVPDTFYIPASKWKAIWGPSRWSRNFLLSPQGGDRLRRNTLQPGLLPGAAERRRGCARSAPVFARHLSAARRQRPAPAGGVTNYRSPASVDNDQQNMTQEIRAAVLGSRRRASSGPRACSSPQNRQTIWNRFMIRCSTS